MLCKRNAARPAPIVTTFPKWRRRRGFNGSTPRPTAHMRLSVLSILTFLAGLNGVCAQESINASGATLSGSVGTISYSIGQVVYQTHSIPEVTFSEGVQQPYEIYIVNGIDVPDIVLQFSAYPNPTRDLLNLNIGNYQAQQLTLQLYDVAGKLLTEEMISEPNTVVDMGSFALSTYYLTIIEGQKVIKTFKIIKN